jgi:hypothetical protein
LTAIHIFFPLSLQQDPNNAQADVVRIASVPNSLSLTGTPVFTVDNTLTYNELCQLYLCYLITFDSQANIDPTKIQVTITNLLNPESVETTKDITVTTMMKYSADPIYYKIDEYQGDSNFKAVRGTMDGASMEVKSLTNDFSTSAINQVYTLTFTP